MHKTTTAALEARLHVLSMALQEVARALRPALAAQVARQVRQRMGALAEGPMSTAVDEVVTAELVPLLAALRASGAWTTAGALAIVAGGGAGAAAVAAGLALFDQLREDSDPAPGLLAKGWPQQLSLGACQ